MKPALLISLDYKQCRSLFSDTHECLLYTTINLKPPYKVYVYMNKKRCRTDFYVCSTCYYPEVVHGLGMVVGEFICKEAHEDAGGTTLKASNIQEYKSSEVLCKGQFCRSTCSRYANKKDCTKCKKFERRMHQVLNPPKPFIYVEPLYYEFEQDMPDNYFLYT